MELIQKWQDMLDRLAERSRCASIWLWHEETLARMQARLMSLKKRSYCRSKQITSKQHKYAFTVK